MNACWLEILPSFSAVLLRASCGLVSVRPAPVLLQALRPLSQNNAEDDDEEQSEMLNGNHQASSQEEDRGSGGPPRPAVRQSVGAVGNGDVSDDDDDDEVDDDNNDDNSGLGAEGKAVADATEANLYEEPREAVLPPVTSSSTTTEAAAAAVSDDDDDDDDDDDADDDKGDEKEDPENVYSSPPPTDKMKVTPPPGMLYMVQATHKYSGEDVDELNFDPGEVIFVIQFENPEEQDDGWQMGIKCSDGMKGVFPENFTQKL
ncbi:nucleolin [Aplysia californica]|uniref:Nucleolin n=1 Tax=Aplysia californica TaxID=6500 RepID=A0ABM0JIK3_APLCA|nr:nucleolin [Aplysia californica]